MSRPPLPLSQEWYICPNCYTISLQLPGNYLCKFCEEYAEKNIPADWRKDNFFQSIVLQKMQVYKCDCGGEKIEWHGLSICARCGNHDFQPGIWVQNDQKGSLHLMTKDVKEIPPGVFKLQKTADLLVFQDINPQTKEIIYWVWLVP